MKSFDDIKAKSHKDSFVKFLDSQLKNLKQSELSFSGDNSKVKAIELNKEAILMDRMIKETKDLFRENYNIKLSFDGVNKSKPKNDIIKELKIWQEKYAEFEALVNKLKKEIGYTDTLNFEGKKEDENPLVPLIEELKKMIAFMETKKDENLYLNEEVIDETEPLTSTEETNITPYLIGGALLGGYLLFKN